MRLSGLNKSFLYRYLSKPLRQTTGNGSSFYSWLPEGSTGKTGFWTGWALVWSSKTDLLSLCQVPGGRIDEYMEKLGDYLATHQLHIILHGFSRLFLVKRTQPAFFLPAYSFFHRYMCVHSIWLAPSSCPCTYFPLFLFFFPFQVRRSWITRFQEDVRVQGLGQIFALNFCHFNVSLNNVSLFCIRDGNFWSSLEQTLVKRNGKGNKENKDPKQFCNYKHSAGRSLICCLISSYRM